mgnify:CR=1 FL=1
MALVFHHVAFTVRDAEQSKKWYQEKLGFAITNERSKNGVDIVFMRLGDVLIELFSFGSETKDLPDYRINVVDDLHVEGTKHLCLGTDDLDKSMAELKSKGVEFVTEVDTGAFGGRYIFFRDCNNILIELFQN